MRELELETTIQRAIDAGLLPACASAPARESEPWPIFILSAAGAGLLLISLLSLLFYFSIVGRGTGEVRFACASIGLAVAIPVSTIFSKYSLGDLFTGAAILTCLGVLGFSAVPLLSDHVAAIGVAIVAMILCFLLVSEWLRMALGATACGAALVAFIVITGPHRAFTNHPETLLYALTFLWGGLHFIQSRLLEDFHAARAAAGLESFCSGWACVLLVLCLALSNPPFVRAGLDDVTLMPGNILNALLSVSFSLAAGTWLAYHWTSLRQLWYLPIVLIVLMLAWPMPLLGAVACVATYCATSGRANLAVGAGISALWIAGRYCYLLSIPLTCKAAILTGAGLAFGLVALGARAQSNQNKDQEHSTVPQRAPRVARASLGVALSAGLTLLVVNIGIVKNERTIAQRRIGFLESQPIEAHSTRQGNFVASRVRL